MCGRVHVTADIEALVDQFQVERSNVVLPHRYNLPPGTVLPVIVQTGGRRLVRPMHWGLVPHWAKDKSMGYKMINARAETLLEKLSFRQPLAQARCIIPVNGYYEWQKETKQPYYFTSRTKGALLAFAGFYALWQHEDEELESSTIITVVANNLMLPIHHRMPCSLEADAVEAWLDGRTSATQAQALLRAPAEDALVCWPVSKTVNSPRHESPDVMDAVG